MVILATLLAILFTTVACKEKQSSLYPTADIDLTEDVIYNVADKEYHGYIAYPNNLKETEKRPGILVVHELNGGGKTNMLSFVLKN